MGRHEAGKGFGPFLPHAVLLVKPDAYTVISASGLSSAEASTGASSRR